LIYVKLPSSSGREWEWEWRRREGREGREGRWRWEGREGREGRREKTSLSRIDIVTVKIDIVYYTIAFLPEIR
jgi:hypothetical protein